MKKFRIFFLDLFLFVTSVGLFAQESAVIDEIVAVVGNKVILLSDIENQYIQYRAQGNIRGGAEQTKCAILESLLFNKLLLNQADIDSVEVTDKQVESELDRRITYFIQ